MRALVLIQGHGPAQGSFATTVSHAWPDSVVLTSGRTLRAFGDGVELPVWAQSELEPGNATMMRRYLRRLMLDRRLERVIAMSTPAISEAARLVPGYPLDGVILGEELEFRASRASKVERFRNAADAVDRLWFTSTYDMDRAVALGSNKPHLLLPDVALRTRLLANEHGRVALLFPSAWSDEERREHVGPLRQVLSESGIAADEITIESLYNRGDLATGRGFPGTIRYRIAPDTSHVVVLGRSAHHAAVVSAFAATRRDRVFVEATLVGSELASRLALPSGQVARGAALAQRVRDAVLADPTASADAYVEQHPLLTAAFEHALAAPLPDWHESGMLESGQASFDVFFTTAGIEDRGDGARPQRIRAMAEAFSAGARVVRLTSNLEVLRRRGRAIRALLQEGSRPHIGYGENSTAPMEPRALDALCTLLTACLSHGLRFGWFVRDLHWLSSEADLRALSPAQVAATRANGLREFEELRRLSNILYAPSEASAAEFDRLLSAAGASPPSRWSALPPAIADEHVLSPRDETGTLRIVYSGGFGGIYAMDAALEAIGLLSVPWTLDLVVREADAREVLDAVRHLPSDRVTVTYGEFKNYVPRSGRSIGLALLESEYGRASFPFKTMSYLEKRIPVLTFAGSATASFLMQQGVGIVASDGVEGILSALEAFARGEGSAAHDWRRVHERESWTARAASVRSQLEAISHAALSAASSI